MNRPETTSLRQRAERKLSGQDLPSKAGLDPIRVLHELQVHQIELELQNEDLLAANLDLDALRSKYQSLYQLAPVGYVTVSPAGLIMELNARAAELLGHPPPGVVGQPLRHQFADVAPAVDALIARAIGTGEEAASEPLLLQGSRAVPIYVQAHARVIHWPEPDKSVLVLIAMMDVSALKFATDDVLSVLQKGA
jgi:PAS domain-containing protein